MTRSKVGDHDVLVLAILGGSATPLSAYQISDIATARGSRVAVAQIYRVLERLTKKKLVRRVELLSAYMLEVEGTNAVFVCAKCRRAMGLALAGLSEALLTAATDRHLDVEKQVVELQGKCPDCSSTNMLP
ncbi:MULTISPECIES: Fur family transcriptional regulator [Sphingobium]|uniref:Fur-family ferric uptake regulator n=1 Tax=Sphingobium indicum (strain DSM 16413 / CCM 7287 / MTCC 6362 / UT26 / NBRC 101211 / UT26S) TaxID=452662 RepID=D4Z291_SPHIU|nr:transcriptional repressor [Sphingobium indicum]BAI96723.1 Fur-family ferric uptake regulator [Sphingobium indicum UT26S]